MVPTRDTPILSDIGEHYTLDTNVIHRRNLAGVTLRRCRQILAALEQDKYLCSARLTATVTGKRLPTLYFLTPQGADAVEFACGTRPPRICRSDPQPHTLLHRWACVQARLAFDASCAHASLAQPQWILESDVRTDADPDLPPNQRSMLYFKTDSAPGVRLDQCCLLALPQSPPLIALWEVDRATEGTPQLSRKAAGLQSLLDHRLYTRLWTNLPAKADLRIFWVVPSETRMHTIQRAAGNLSIAHLYRFLLHADAHIRTETTPAESDGSQGARNLLTDPVWHFLARDTWIARPLLRR
jgi:hypothetical protein